MQRLEVGAGGRERILHLKNSRSIRENRILEPCMPAEVKDIILHIVCKLTSILGNMVVGGGGSSWRHEVNAGAQSLRRQLTRTSMLKLILRVSFARQECDPELKAGEPLLQDVILYGRELTQDDDLDEHEKEKITRDMTQLLEHYDHLRNFIDDEQERFVIYIIIYIRQFNSDLFLFLVVPRKSATQRGSDAIIPSILPPG